MRFILFSWEDRAHWQRSAVTFLCNFTLAQVLGSNAVRPITFATNAVSLTLVLNLTLLISHISTNVIIDLIFKYCDVNILLIYRFELGSHIPIFVASR